MNRRFSALVFLAAVLGVGMVNSAEACYCGGARCAACCWTSCCCTVLGFAEALRHVESGQVNSYMLVFLLGVLAMIIFFAVLML